jgi:hypothetical protein
MLLPVCCLLSAVCRLPVLHSWDICLSVKKKVLTAITGAYITIPKPSGNRLKPLCNRHREEGKQSGETVVSPGGIERPKHFPVSYRGSLSVFSYGGVCLLLATSGGGICGGIGERKSRGC